LIPYGIATLAYGLSPIASVFTVSCSRP